MKIKAVFCEVQPQDNLKVPCLKTVFNSSTTISSNCYLALNKEP